MSKELNEKQEKFLEVLFTEAGGNLTKAKNLAGYSPSTKTSHVTKGIQDEIIQLTRDYLTTNGPKAAISIIQILDDPTSLGNKDKLAAAKDLLDRIGLKSSEKIEVKTSSPLFILPSKEK